ncbi:MAG: hypothetical protein ABI461_11970 [Polyangiaceae bacterium]
MLTTRKRNALVLSGVVIAAAASFVLFGRSSGKSGSSVLDAIPADAFLVATFDIAALRNCPLAAPLAPFVAKLGASEVEAQCGFEPIARVDQLAVAIPEGQDGEFGILAHGNLSREEMSKCASAVISARGGSPAEAKSGNFSLVSDATSALGTPSKIGWDDSGLVLIGRGGWFGEMMDASLARRPRITSNAAHTELREALGKSRLVTITTTLPAALRRKIERQMQSDSEGENAMMQGVLGVGAAGIAVGITGDQTEIVLELRCDTTDACTQVQTLIAKKKADWSANLTFRAFGIAALMDALELQVDGQKLHAKTHVATGDARRLIERALAFRDGKLPKMPAGDAGAEPPTLSPRSNSVDRKLDTADEVFPARTHVVGSDAGARTRKTPNADGGL